MILDIYKDSFEFASKKLSNLIILGVLFLFSFLIIPAIIFYGYNYKVIKQSTESMINGGDVPPEIEGFKEIFVNGLRYLVVEIVYGIIPLLIIYLGSTFGNSLSATICGIIGIILFIIAELFTFAALPHMASNDDSLRKAFDIKELNHIINSIGYGRYLLNYIGIKLISLAIVLVFVILFFGVMVLILGLSVPVFGPSFGFMAVPAFIIMAFLFDFIVMPYLSVFSSRCFGLIYNIRG